MQCRVLRCTNPATHVFDLNVGDLPFETKICDEHHAQIAAGAEWSFDADDDAVLVGNDLKVAGRRRVAAFEGFTEDIGTMAGGGGTLLKFRYEDGEPFVLLASPEVLLELARAARLMSWENLA